MGAHAEHRDAVHAGLQRVYGIADPAAAPVEAAGRTDIEIARHICLLSGVDARTVDAGLPELREAIAEEYANRVPADLTDRVAPGADELLETLGARDSVLLSLVTGNLEPVARMKLRAAGLGRWFPAGQGGFGSDHEDRTILPGVARLRAGARGRPYPRPQTVVIGDTPRDIACARADGVRCIGVANGPYPPEALWAADAVASDARSVLAALDGLE